MPFLCQDGIIFMLIVGTNWAVTSRRRLEHNGSRTFTRTKWCLPDGIKLL